MGSAAVVQQVTWEEALSAGRVLFGTRAESLLAGSEWRDELKRAYKRRVLETHPDRAKALGRGEAELSREFRAVADAYRLLQEAPDARLWLRARPAPAAWRPPSRSDAAEAARVRQQAEARARQQADAWARKQAEARARDEAEARWAEHARMAEEARQARQREEKRRARARVRPDPAPAASPPPAADWRHVVKPRPMPRRRVRLAEYLYYSGRISWAAMIEAIAWQRRQRPAVGRIAVDFGFLTPLEVIDVIARRQRAGAHDVPFGEFALRLGMITPFERLAMVGRQVRLQRPIGQYFVERGLVDEQEFEDLRRQIVRHNLRHYR